MAGPFSIRCVRFDTKIEDFNAIPIRCVYIYIYIYTRRTAGG